jgi:hypothetical protein
MYIKTPAKQTFKGISKGKPAQNKRKNLKRVFDTDGSAPSHGRRTRTNEKSIKNKLPVFTPWKIVLASLLIGICGIYYINHVFNTQQTLLEVNQLQIEHNRAMRQYHEKRLIYDRMTGPKEIYQQARQQGFINAGPADLIIKVDSDSE